MAHLPHRRHGYFPQRRATLLPLVARLRVQLALEGIPAETLSHPATAAEEPSPPAGHESYQSCNGKSRAASPSGKRQRQPAEDVAALLKRIRIHPEAQRILGNSCIPVVSLERLNFQSVYLSSLQPVVSLVRLPCHTQAERHSDAFCLDQQNGVSQNEENILEIIEAESKPAESSDFSQTDSTLNSWTEPYCPDTPSSGEPEQDSGFDCESNPDQPYILFDSGSDEWDPDARTGSETFYLDPDPEQTMVIELDPETEADQDPCLELEDEAETRLEVDIVQMETKCEVDLVQVETKCEVDLFQMETKCETDLVQVETKCETDLVQVETKCETDLVQVETKCETDLVQVETKCETDLVQVETKCETDLVQVDDIEDQKPGPCCSQKVEDYSSQQPEPGRGIEEMESEDFCAVCLNGGDLLCCDRCPKVYHLACHIPPLTSFPVGDWVCTLCRSDQEPVETYDCENMNSCGGVKALYALSNQDQRRCEKLTLLLYSHTLSAPFHEPVSPLARNYYQIIKRPINLSVIRRKLDKSNTLHYFTAEQFVDDVLLMFKNCATFNYPDSEVAQAGRNLEVFFFSKLREIFPGRTFPSANQDTTDRARLRWLGRKRKESHRKKRFAFSGKKYYL